MSHFYKLIWALTLFGVSPFTAHAAVVTAHFTSAETVPVTASSYTATGNTVTLSLGFAPTTGTNLTVVRNTGLPFINGTFSNLAQGQAVSLLFGGVVYNYVANYYSGNGNDLVLHWADSRLMGWGSGGLVGDDSYTLRNSPVDVTSTGVLAGKTLVSVASGSLHSPNLHSHSAQETHDGWKQMDCRAPANGLETLGDPIDQSRKGRFNREEIL